MPELDNALLRSVVDASEVGIILLAPDGRIVLWSRWMERVSDLPGEETLGRQLVEVFPEIAETRIPHAIEEAIERGMSSMLSQPLNKRLFPLLEHGGLARGTAAEDDGPMMQMVMVKPVSRAAGGSHCLIQISDITKALSRETLLRRQSRTMQALADNYRMSELHIRAILDNAMEAVITLDNEGHIETFNRAAEAIFECTTDEVLGKSVSLIMALEPPSAPPTAPPDLGRFRADGPKTWECEGRRGDGTTFPLEFSLARMEVDGRTSHIVTARDITKRKDAEARVHYLAFYDSLTDLPNRVLFQERLAQAVRQSRRSESRFSLLALDLDNLKTVNDTLGHHHGDLLLRSVARRLAGAVRESDTVARLSGDEFAVILTHLHDVDGARLVAESILTAMKAPLDLEGRLVTSSFSIGIAMFPEHSADPEELMRFADAAMYRSKAEGKGAYTFYDPGMSAGRTLQT